MHILSYVLRTSVWFHKGWCIRNKNQNFNFIFILFVYKHKISLLKKGGSTTLDKLAGIK